MGIELTQPDDGPARLHRETDHTSIEMELTTADVEALHEGLRAILRGDEVSVGDEHILVEHTPHGPNPVLVVYDRGRTFAPMHFTEAEAESLRDAAARLLAMVIKQ